MLGRLGGQLVLAMGTASLALLACNAIIGVEDVTLADGDGGKKKRPDGGDVELPPDGFDPTRDGGAAPVNRATLALGFSHSCARLLDSTVKCWGENGAGQLGDGVPFETSTGKPALIPQDVSGISDATDIGAGLAHTCVVHATGAVSCWGINLFGQLGDGTKTRSSSPVSVLSIQDAVAIAGGESFTCALQKGKTVSCWGANAAGQLGDETKTDRGTPAPVRGLSGAVSLTAAKEHACAVLESGDVMCWGANANGQLGNGSITESLTPTKVAGLTGVAQVAAATRFACARQKAGPVYCWGNNAFGQLGSGSPNDAANPSPILVGDVPDAIFLWAGFEHACAVRKSGAVVCWGKAQSGQIGSGTAEPSVPKPTAVVGVGTSRAVWTGGDRSCALTQDGKAFCWGANSAGQLGNGTTDDAPEAVQVSGFP